MIFRVTFIERCYFMLDVADEEEARRAAQLLRDGGLGDRVVSVDVAFVPLPPPAGDKGPPPREGARGA